MSKRIVRPNTDCPAADRPDADCQNSLNIPEKKILIGTSGWHYRHWIGNFYPAGFPPREMLSFYSREFATVEINNSFYRLPEKDTFWQWREQTPPGFVFAVKASRFITHLKRLREPKDPVDLLLERASPLGPSLGPILFQLPPQGRADFGRLSAFLEVIPKRPQFVLEFRNQSWCREDVYALLRKNNVAMCFHDWGGEKWPQEITANFAYFRFHGAGQRYGGDYSKEALKRWADKIRSWYRDLDRIYVYFNNDAHGCAIRNARTLRQMLGLRDPLQRPLAA